MDKVLRARCLDAVLESGGEQRLEYKDNWIEVQAPGDGTARVETSGDWFGDASTSDDLYSMIESGVKKTFGDDEILSTFLSHLCPDEVMGGE